MGRKLYLLESMNLERGDTFEFGVWNNKPIEWQVLANRGGILCISKYCLAESIFDPKSNKWETSELRQWLNSDFYNKAFDSEEKSFILSNKEDKVTLLSFEEAYEFLPTNSKRIATYKGRFKISWWLRSRGVNNSAVRVFPDGYIHIYDLSVDVMGSVRPVIYLKKDVENFLEPEEV